MKLYSAEYSQGYINTMETSHSSYSEFADQDFYKVSNSYLVEHCNIVPGNAVIDLACGTGAVTELILEKVQDIQESIVLGIDMSKDAIKESMDRLSNWKNVNLKFIQSKVEHLSEIVKILINTAFFQGAVPQETESFYRRWMMKSLRTLKSEYGLSPKSDKDKVESRKQLTPEEYTSLLEDNGFTVNEKILLPTPMTLNGFLTISEYEEFIDGAMPGVPIEKGKNSLKNGARIAFDELNLRSVPRNWLTIIASKN